SPTKTIEQTSVIPYGWTTFIFGKIFSVCSINILLFEEKTPNTPILIEDKSNFKCSSLNNGVTMPSTPINMVQPNWAINSQASIGLYLSIGIIAAPDARVLNNVFNPKMPQKGRAPRTIS